MWDTGNFVKTVFSLKNSYCTMSDRLAVESISTALLAFILLGTQCALQRTELTLGELTADALDVDRTTPVASQGGPFQWGFPAGGLFCHGNVLFYPKQQWSKANSLVEVSIALTFSCSVHCLARPSL